MSQFCLEILYIRNFNFFLKISTHIETTTFVAELLHCRMVQHYHVYTTKDKFVETSSPQIFLR